MSFRRIAFIDEFLDINEKLSIIVDTIMDG